MPPWEPFPWLGALPPELFDRLDRAEFAAPIPELDRVRAHFEAVTGHRVMTYRLDRAGPAPGRVSLCALIETATLTTDQAELLRDCEVVAARHGACLVAYRTPVTLRTSATLPILD